MAGRVCLGGTWAETPEAPAARKKRGRDSDALATGGAKTSTCPRRCKPPPPDYQPYVRNVPRAKHEQDSYVNALRRHLDFQPSQVDWPDSVQRCPSGHFAFDNASR